MSQEQQEVGGYDEAFDKSLEELEEWCADLDAVHAQTVAEARRRLRASMLPGWICCCGVFNGDAKERLSACRSCGLARRGPTAVRFAPEVPTTATELFLAMAEPPEGSHVGPLMPRVVLGGVPEPRCIRCGAPYDATGACSMRERGPCQGGRGEWPGPLPPTAEETPYSLADNRKLQEAGTLTKKRKT